MSNKLYQRDFLKETDFTPEELTYLLDLAAQLKQAKKARREPKFLADKNVVILFEKDSTRTRCSFEVAAYDQGARITYLGPSGSQMGKKESLADTARVLARFYDGIEYRGYEQARVEALAKHAHVPVWNGLTNEWHPTQFLADMLTQELRYNTLMDQLDELEADGRICCVRPQEPITIGRFEGDENKLLDLYNRGHREGREALDKVRGYLEK